MRAIVLVAALLCSLPALAQPAAPAADWKDFTPLIGEWVADASGPGGPSGGFVLEPALGGRVLVRKNWPSTRRPRIARLSGTTT